MLILKYTVDLVFMAVVCLPNRSWIFVCMCECPFTPQFPAASFCVCVATLDLHVKTHIYGLFIPAFSLQGLRCWFLSSPVDSPSLHVHIHTLSQPGLSTASPFGQGLCSVMQVRSLSRGSPGGKPERKEGVEWVKKNRKREILGVDLYCE